MLWCGNLTDYLKLHLAESCLRVPVQCMAARRYAIQPP